MSRGRIVREDVERQSMRVPLIEDNPLRVLGAYANSTQRETEQNKAQLRAFARVGQEVQLPLWLNGLSLLAPLPAVTEELLTQAQARLALQKDRDHHARFWFERDGDHAQEDGEAFVLLNHDQTDEACQLWGRRTDYAARKNLLLLSVLRDDWHGIAANATRCFERNTSDFRLFMHEVAKTSVEANGSHSYHLLDYFTEEPWKAEMKLVLVKHHKQALDEAIDRLTRTQTTDAVLLKKEIERMDEEECHVDALVNLLGDDSFTCSYYANMAAKTRVMAVGRYVEHNISAEEVKWAVSLVDKVWRGISSDDPDYHELLRIRLKVIEKKKTVLVDEPINQQPPKGGCWWDFLGIVFYLMVQCFLIFGLAKACGGHKKKDPYYRYPYRMERFHQPINYKDIPNVPLKINLDSIVFQHYLNTPKMVTPPKVPLQKYLDSTGAIKVPHNERIDSFMKHVKENRHLPMPMERMEQKGETDSVVRQSTVKGPIEKVKQQTEIIEVFDSI